VEILVPISSLKATVVKTEDKPKISLTMEVECSALKLADIMTLKSPLSATFASSQLPLDSLLQGGQQAT
jgi:hypothetical protein